MKYSANEQDLAHRIAAEFWDLNPDPAFKKTWPTAQGFVEAAWKTYLDAARKMIAEQNGEQFIIINGQQIETQEAMAILKGLYHEAEEAAGEFHNKNRSEKFRKNWPDEYLFAKANWKNFVVEARRRYADKLADPRTPRKEAEQIHMALVLEHEIAQGQERDNRLQLGRNSQQFEGDPFENKKIVNQFGKQSNTFKELLLNSTSPSKRYQ